MDEAWSAPEFHCRHLIVCRTIWFDPSKPEEDFSLGRLVVRLTAGGTSLFPLRVARLFLFAQVYGTPGEFRALIRLVRIDPGESEEETETHLGLGGDPLEFLLPRPVVVSGLQLVDGFAVPLVGVTFPTPGLYEFQLWRDGEVAPIARERLEVFP